MGAQPHGSYRQQPESAEGIWRDLDRVLGMSDQEKLHDGAEEQGGGEREQVATETPERQALVHDVLR